MYIRLVLVMMNMVVRRTGGVKKGGAQMNGMIKAAKGTGKVLLAILVGVLMPIMIWVALGVALNKKLREKAARETEVRPLGEALTKAGQTIKR